MKLLVQYEGGLVPRLILVLPGRYEQMRKPMQGLVRYVVYEHVPHSNLALCSALPVVLLRMESTNWETEKHSHSY